MSNIKVLDCTLRDGGYVNNWDFKYKNINQIINNLVNAKIDYIECGFLKFNEYVQDKSLFYKTQQLTNLLPKNIGDTKFTLMINYGEYDINDIPESTNNKILFRIAFKKNACSEVLKYCKTLKNKGYEIFINPMHTNTYSSKELLDLLAEVNNIKPLGFTIVDTTGGMKEKDILTLFYLIDSNLDNDIALCFHSHNNLQLSFSNAQCLMKICKNRKLIIDSTIFGIGRGAGNLCTELITQYINDNYNGHYDIVPILKTVDEQINPIFAKTPWGYSVPYYLAATNHCHPNYAKYLIDKQTVPVEVINELLKTIPENKKSGYDANLIKQIYLDNFSKNIDDTFIVKKLKTQLSERNILLMAPGKSLSIESDKIHNFIKKENPYIISINFIPKNYNINVAFVSNMKRFSSLDDIHKPIYVTSNIDKCPDNANILNYSLYLNDSKMYDNAALMCLKLLMNIGVKKVNIAGLDGFSNIPTENYVSNELINNAIENEFDERNQIMSEELKKYSESIVLNFITKTQYLI